MEELKPCPFCGSGYIVNVSKDVCTDRIKREPTHALYCMGCGTQTRYYFTWEEAVKAWNRRAGRKTEN